MHAMYTYRKPLTREAPFAYAERFQQVITLLLGVLLYNIVWQGLGKPWPISVNLFLWLVLAPASALLLLATSRSLQTNSFGLLLHPLALLAMIPPVVLGFVCWFVHDYPLVEESLLSVMARLYFVGLFALLSAYIGPVVPGRYLRWMNRVLLLLALCLGIVFLQPYLNNATRLMFAGISTGSAYATAVMSVAAFFLFFPHRGSTPQTSRWLLMLFGIYYLLLLYLCLRTGGRGGLVVLLLAGGIYFLHITWSHFMVFLFSLRQMTRITLVTSMVIVSLLATGILALDFWYRPVDLFIQTLVTLTGRGFDDVDDVPRNVLRITGGEHEGIEGEVRYHFIRHYYEAISQDQQLLIWGEGYPQDNNPVDLYPAGNTVQDIGAVPHNYFFGMIVYGGLVYFIPSLITLSVIVWQGHRLLVTHRTLRPAYRSERLLLSGIFYGTLPTLLFIILFENQSYIFHEWNYQAAFGIVFFCAGLNNAMRHEARKGVVQSLPARAATPSPHTG